ncbi:MAG TPA: formate/nitrite transporter family protein [Rhizomicrobium sp.]|jgi:formate/nitrite transporter FocA (FNT family)
MSDQQSSKSQDSSFTGASKLDELSPRQKREVEKQSRPNAALIHETIRAEGVSELERTSWALALSGLAAGLSMGFSLLVQATLTGLIPDAMLRGLIAPLGYTTGFLIVVLGRQQLFTENTLTPMLPLLHNRDGSTLFNVLRLWAVVLVANVAGTWTFAWVLSHTAILDQHTASAALALAHESVKHDFGYVFVKAVFAGWLIALMVWLLPAAETARIWIIIILTYIIALGQDSHIIAGSVECAYLVQSGQAGLGEYLLRFFLPTLLGNIAGGVTLVAVLNYGQVVPEIEGSE